MTDFQDSHPDRPGHERRAQARVVAAKATQPDGIDPEMMAFGLKLAFGVALFQLSLVATLFGQFTRG